MSQSLADQLATTALSGGNADFIEDLYDQFLRDPSGVDPAWREYFNALQSSGSGRGRDVAHGPIRERILARVQNPPTVAPQGSQLGASAKQGAVSRLIQVYANRGHLIANLVQGCTVGSQRLLDRLLDIVTSERPIVLRSCPKRTLLLSGHLL